MKFLLLYFLAVTACAQQNAHDQWKKLFNTNIDSIQNAYVPNAVLVTTDGTVHSTSTALISYYAELKKEIRKIKSVATIYKEEGTPELSFEISYFISDKEKKFIQLTIERKFNNILLREVEISSESSGEPVDLASIKNSRDIWMKLCNSHRANELVSTIYTDNAVYYNNHRVLVGTSAIAAEYRYMNNPNYTLTLTPTALEAVTKNLAFEIGQCSGSYNGKYILVWKKIGNNWKVLFDSN